MAEYGKHIVIDMNHVERGLAEFDKFSKDYEKAVEASTRECKERTKNKLLENLGNYKLGGSSLARSIYALPTHDGFEVGSYSGHADFVEFGTGTVGSNSPHPAPMENSWEYNIERTPKAHENGGWWYYDDNGKRHWTKGQPSRPFIYNTWKWTNSRNGYVRIIRRHLRKLGL